MEFIKENKLTVIFAGILLLLTFILWWPTRTLPYWWDSAGYIMGAANYYLETNFSSFIFPPDAPFSVHAHPPLFSFILALLWKAFGQSLLVSHIYYLFFVILASLGTYWLGKEIADFKDDLLNHLVGFSASLFLLLSPLYLAQIGIIYVEIPAAAFAVWAVYFFIKRKALGYMAAGALMVLMKEVSIVIIAAVGLVLLAHFIKDFKTKKEERKNLTIQFLKDAAVYAFPALVLFGWFVWHRAVAGWWFNQPHYQETFNQNLVTFSADKFKFVFNYFFTAQSRWMIAALMAIFLFIIFSRHGVKRFLKKELYPIFLAMLFVPLLFGKIDFINRYIIFGLPFYFIAFSYIWAYVLHPEFKEHAAETGKKVVYIGSALLIGFMFTLHWNNGIKLTTWHFAPIEENVEYMDVIRVGKEMANYIETNYPTATVYTGFPSNYMLRKPFQGYVSKPVDARDCTAYKEGDKVDLVVFHVLSPTQVQCKNLIQHLGLQPLDEGGFAHNGKWMQIYVPPEKIEEAQQAESDL
ncbi:MAG: glycosyltransferase family 39 protein [Candidatus Spechtbacterales bacterium]|nr:glycosyltransferase family 39 protein [Candidatus Spechtbacterales bacterium]